MAEGEARSADHLKLRNVAKASIRAEKISDYLLSPTHPVGRHKAGFFRRFGFAQSATEALRTSMLEHARSHEVTSVNESRFGKRYAIDGPLQSPDGRNPALRVIWFIDAGKDEPRFVTAYPLAKENA